MNNLQRMVLELFKIQSSISRIQALNCPDIEINTALVDISIKCGEISSKAVDIYNSVTNV